ncbi:MAG: phosphoglucomutase/phosphomannomutase family protein [Caldisericia bacterium]|nr:phosphoglucomutase/phosphomannomutase family protein [Caldisericia bacterium]
MDNRIKFGTSGWRGVIADDFTFGNIRKVSRGIKDYLLDENIFDKGIVVGYDTRFLSKEFAKEVSKIFAQSNVKVLFLKEPSPTPVISYTILKYKTSGGVNITASHNPYYYSGIKFSPSWGGPAEPEVTKKIEDFLNKETEEEVKEDFDYYVNKGLIEIIDPFIDYIEDLLKILPYKLELNHKIILDPMFGTGIRYFNKIFENFSNNVFIIHNNHDPLFGGLEPVPYEEFLSHLKNEVINKNAFLGLALDGDADRFGIISSDGTFITPNEVLSLLSYYLGKGKKEGIGRTISTTRLIDKIANYYNIEVFETPVGFKFIGMLIRDGKIYIGGEESGGLSIKGWLPEKDGILADLLVLQICEKENSSPKELIDELYKKFGKFYTKRLDLRFKKEEREIVKNYIDNFNETSIFNLKIKNIDKKDGLLLNLEGDFTYILFRISGTEDVVRVYFETQDKSLFDYLNSQILNFINSIVR